MVVTKFNHPYAGWRRCVELSNATIELVATTEVGPRIIRFAFHGKENELFEYANQVGKTGGDEWRSYGGHRLWHAPEVKPRTYSPDNAPVHAYEEEGALILEQAIEPSTGIQKTMEIRLHDEKPEVAIVHRLTNRGLWPARLAVWPVTVLAPGGTGIFPLGKYIPFPEQLGPSRPLVLWSYTNMNDPRFDFGARYIRMRYSREMEQPLKIGLFVDEGWSAYQRGDHLFVKRFPRPDRSKTFADFGVNVEAFTNKDMFELESLSPYTELEPGGFVEHVESWQLIDRVGRLIDEKDIERVMARG